MMNMKLPPTVNALARNFRLHCIACDKEVQRFEEEVDLKHAEQVVNSLLAKHGTACTACEEMYTLTYEVQQQEFPMAISWDYLMHCRNCGAEPMYVRSAGGKRHLAEAMGPCLECDARDWQAKPVADSQEIRMTVTNDELPF